VSGGANRSLVIGIGNPLRSDDGVAWRLVEEVDGRCVQQLTPELAAELVAVERVLFVDAWLAPRQQAVPQLLSVVACEAPGDAPGAVAAGTGPRQELALSHHLDPAGLLGMAELLFSARPAAWQLLVPAFSLAHGTTLSPPLAARLPAARRLLRRWLRQGEAGDA
jgi:hydrogenase maturation protease